MDTEMLPGHLILITAPSGSGKGQLINYIMSTFPEIVYAKSDTTRPKRPREVSGGRYVFIPREQFEKNIAEKRYIEWAEYSGNLYGTSYSEVMDPLKAGHVVLKEMELQGVCMVKEALPASCLTILYIDAGPWEALKKRIMKRAPISKDELEQRR